MIDELTFGVIVLMIFIILVSLILYDIFVEQKPAEKTDGICTEKWCEDIPIPA